MSIVYGLSRVGFATFGCVARKITNIFVEKSAIWATFDIIAASKTENGDNKIMLGILDLLALHLLSVYSPFAEHLTCL